VVVTAAAALPTEFEDVSDVFRFSCDELCLRLKPGASEWDAARLGTLLSEVFSELHMFDLVRVDVFRLDRVPYSTNVANAVARALAQGDQGDDTTSERLHAGHSALREARRFEDRLGHTNAAWEEPRAPLLTPDEECADSFFVRRPLPGSGEVLKVKKLPGAALHLALLETVRASNVFRRGMLVVARQASARARELLSASAEKERRYTLPPSSAANPKEKTSDRGKKGGRGKGRGSAGKKRGRGRT
jgi:hypothetical protein